MLSTYKLPNGGFISIREGTEGPRHDPYGFVEITVSRNLKRVTFHAGLGTWSKVKWPNGVTSELDSFDHKAHAEHFERHTGYWPCDIKRFCEQADRRREQRFYDRFGFFEQEIRDAERRAGWDPNP